MKQDEHLENALLSGWEDVYLKSQLTLWVLLALKAADKHMAEIKSFIQEATNKTLSPDDKSMYRSLRRLAAGEMIYFVQKPAKNGPDYKVYSLTKVGQRVLDLFLERHITTVFYNPTVRSLIEKGYYE